MEKLSGIKMKKDALKGYKQVTASHVGKKMELTVSHNVTESNRVISAKGERESYIVGLKAFSPDKADAIRELFKDRTEVDIEETNGLFLTANIWLNNGVTSTELPMKGENIDCLIGEVADRDGQAVIRVTSVKTRQATQAKALDLDSFFANEESVEETADASKSLVSK